MGSVASAFQKVQLNEDSISSDSSSTTENSLDEEDSGNDSDSLMDLDSLSDEAIAIGIVKFGTRRQRHSPSTALSVQHHSKNSKSQRMKSNQHQHQQTWTKEMDGALRTAVERNLYGNWKSIRVHFGENIDKNIKNSSKTCKSSSRKSTSNNSNSTTKRSGLNPLLDCSESELEQRW